MAISRQSTIETNGLLSIRFTMGATISILFNDFRLSNTLDQL